jgi:putative ABC transport system permease protein
MVLKKWLKSFVYRTDKEITTFALAGVLALAIALITVGYHVAKSVIVDPVTSLRYE